MRQDRYIVGRTLSALALASFILTGCTTTSVGHAHRPAHVSALRAEAEFNAEQVKFIDDNCGPFGMPQLDKDWDHGPTVFVVREGYVLQHSSTDKIAKWVCEHVTKEEVTSAPGVTRRDPFAPDPQLTGKPRSELSDYKGSGFDRGHAAPAGDQNSSQRLKDETFFLSNMSPQTPAHNQQIWAALEDLVRSWIDNGTVDSEFVVTGGFFFDPREENPATADGIIDYETVGAGAVAVPTHYFKIVLAQDHSGQWEAVAFVEENRAYKKPFDFTKDIKPIAWIEERTGIDFFPQLDPNEKHRLEDQSGTLFH
jgi:endonuclease G